MLKALSGRRIRADLHVRLLAAVLVGLLPIAVLLGFLWQGARERDRAETMRSLTQTTEAVAVVADAIFDEGITLGKVIAAEPAVRSLDPARFVPYLRDISAQTPQYPNIVVLDGNGTILGSSVAEPPPNPSVAGHSFFARVTASGQPTTLHVVDDAGPHALGTGVAVPIVSTDGSPIGVVAIAFDPSEVRRRLGQVRPFSGQAFSLIDPTGRIAMFIGPVEELAGGLSWEARDRSQVPQVQEALAGRVATTPSFRGALTGQERLAAFGPTPRHGWVVNATWTVEQALAPTRQAEQREIVIFLGIVLIILIGALILSRSLIAPLQRLAEHVRQLGDGHFEPIAGVRSDDEIGDLATTFNTMGERLQRTVDDLRDERARLETILHNLPVGVLIASAPSGDIVNMNAEAERVWGAPFNGPIPYELYRHASIVHPDGQPFPSSEWPLLRSLHEGATVRGQELVLRNLDGTETVLNSNAAPIRDASGRIIASVASYDDITERRRTEALLREREAMLRVLIDQFPGAVAVFDRDLRYVLAAGRRVIGMGVALESLVGRRLADIFPPEQLAATAPYHRRAFDGETVTFDTEVADKTIQVTMTPIVSDSSTVELLLSVSFDVTQERAELNRSVRDEKLQALGQMAGGIAHNLNQTLALVTGYAEMVRTGLDQAPGNLSELRQMLRIVEHAAYDGGETVKRLLTFARGREDESRQPIDVADLLHEVGQLTAPRWRESASAEGHPVDLRVVSEPGLVVVGSRGALREVLTNLVFNALDAMPRGGSIVLTARADADQVLIDVADTGTGMSPEVQRQIFEPFFTTKGERGTGLGLAMVFGIIRQHDGGIDVSSQLGEGTTFHLRLPASVAVESETTPAEEAPASRSLSILVVDDEARLAALAAGMLRADGHRATQASSGLAALEQLRIESFDLVISDLSMGEGMNGWELAAEIQRISPDLPVILSTGWGAAIDEQEARERGIRAILAKPFRLADLREVVARAVST